MSSQNKKNTKQKVETNYIDLLYMTSHVLNAKELSVLLQDTPGLTIELWEEMNILEIELPNKNCIDFEPLSTSFKAPSDAAFVKNREIKTIYAINICDSDIDTIVTIFDKIVGKYSGFLCADSEDFMPVYAGSSNR